MSRAEEYCGYYWLDWWVCWLQDIYFSPCCFFASTPLSVKSSYLSHLPYHFLRFLQSKAQFYFFRPILNKKSTNNQLAIQKYSNQSDEILRNIAFTLQSLFFPSISFSLHRNSLITQHLRSGFPTVFIFVFPLLFLRSLITLFSNVFSLHVCFLVYWIRQQSLLLHVVASKLMREQRHYHNTITTLF